MTKYIFVTGGVVSSVGKGISVASIGRLLKSRGFSISLQKLDPYLNVDPGTMSPYQHGEVFVTSDGGETDLDLGHYERFVDINLTRASNVTAGQVYSDVIARERRGDYLGGTIQVVPHVTNAIKDRIFSLARDTGADIVVVEVGGTVGDMEGQPFLEAIRQMRNEVGRDDVYYIHVTLLPYISATGELKTKPTQQSVRELRGMGIQPDAIICRSDYDVPANIKEKIAFFCDVDEHAVIAMPTVPTIYEVPLILDRQGFGDLITKQLGLPQHPHGLSEWEEMVERAKASKETVKVAVVGKYVDLPDAYLSVREALRHAALFFDQDVDLDWVPAEEIERVGPEILLGRACGIVVPGGFGPRGIEGMIKTATYARERKVPYLGLCLGMQVMVTEFARSILELEGANSTEFDQSTRHPVIDLMTDQRGVTALGGTMRLGLYPCLLGKGGPTANSYGVSEVQERHRHRFEFNNRYREDLEQMGLHASGLSPDGTLVEIVEVESHPFMIGVQFHPEFLSRPNRPHPLFKSFMDHARKVIREGGQPPLPLQS